MFGHMKAEPILTLRPASSLEEAIRILIGATDGAQPVRWLEFPAAVLLFLTIAGDLESGAFYVLDRKTGTWFWVDFEDEEYGGFCLGGFYILLHPYEFLRLVEPPALFKARAGLLFGTPDPREK